jgi:hypothetical protein
MRVAVYLSHPRAGSFHHAVFDAVVGELRERGAEVVVHDLCAEGFPAVLSADETGTVKEAERVQEGQVDLHRAEVAALDAMVFGEAGRIRVTRADGLAEGVRRAVEEPGPVLLDVLTNPEEIAVPAKPTVQQGWGFAIAKVRENLNSAG